MHKMAEGPKVNELSGVSEFSANNAGEQKERGGGGGGGGSLEVTAGVSAAAAAAAAATAGSHRALSGSFLTEDSEAALTEASRSTGRRSSIIKDATRQKTERKKTVSFSSMPSEKKISKSSDCLSFMQAGCELKKIRSNSRLYHRFFMLDIDFQALRWEPSKKDPEKAKINVSSIKEIWVGKNTEIFRSCAFVDQISEECAFSIIHGDNYQSLDLVAYSTEVANIWITGIRYLISHSNPSVDLAKDQNTLRQKWLTAQFQEADADGFGIMLEDTAVALIKKLNPAMKETKIRNKFKELQKGKEKLINRVTEEEFCDAYSDLCTRPEVYYLLVQISNNKEFIGAKDLMLFLETEQGMTQVTEEMCLDIIQRYEPSLEGQISNQLGIDGFTQFLISPECDIFDPEHNKVCQDMTQPLSHYYISSSHNTYLTEGQYRGPANLQGFIRALTLGFRSIELNVYNGPDNEPIICNRNAMSNALTFRNVIEVISKYAFMFSEYPLILSLGNHCSVEQQRVMVQHMKKILGNKIFTEHPNSSQTYLPSPEKVKRKIILKGRVMPPHSESSDGYLTNDDEETYVTQKLTDNSHSDNRLIRLCKELSDLITLCQCIHFTDFNTSMKNQKYWHMCNFNETMASKLANEFPEEFVNHNKKFLSRVYPSAMRIDSGNMNPQEFWNCGCQIVSMNCQTPGPMMDLNIGWFQQNGRCGYVLRPSIMREEVSYFSANIKGMVPGVLPQTLHLKIISGQNFPKPKGAGAKGDVIDPYVCVEIHGIPTDCAELRTRTVHQNGDNPMFDASLEFEINLPELVQVRFVVLDDDYIGDEFIGQYTIPYECLQPGYRHVPLLSFTGELIEYATLFIHVAITNQRGCGKSHKRRLSVRKVKKEREYTILKTTGIKAIDDFFKSASNPLQEAADIRENMQNAVVSFKEACGLSPISNLKQCIKSFSPRLLNSDNIPIVQLTKKEQYPFLETQGTIPEAQKKVLMSYDLMIQESKYLIEMADTIYDKINQSKKTGLEFHEDLTKLGSKEGLKGRKLNKAFESFAWNMTILKGQGDLLKNAKIEALENMKQIHTVCLSCGLVGSGRTELKAKQNSEATKEKETGEENGKLK
ncbi:inactive phospholipase C-like protein 1 [Callorhinchus milii]|uniref:Phosphoinositide phospholipase C n=1 Tax=Callorhinchus milii TaxID=7868 RepID=A0A4W3ITN6_CALMI|nr:inactive phospholipase C-like protein 1 [Callorhinchus milii]|eukprot:gi/632964155/ref/XP_007898261.1/ PREDICTED: inactive phospholipase C-like protein 1 [Callorhinchus milii]